MVYSYIYTLPLKKCSFSSMQPPPQRRKPRSGLKMASSSRRLCLALLFTVASVRAGVLPEVPDQKGAAGSNLGNHVPTAEEQSSFMDRFLSKVTSSSGKPEDKPEPAVLEHDEEEEEEPTVESRRGGGRRHGRRRHKKHRGGDHRHHVDAGTRNTAEE